MQYFILHKNSNLIAGFIASSFSPAKSEHYRFIPASEKSVDSYFKWLSKNGDICPDLGDLALKSKYLNDKVNPKGSELRTTVPRYTEDVAPSSREATIASWIAQYPNTDEHALNDKFLCGVTVARAYLNKYL
ncbi:MULTISPECIES: hypothetical protein [unclassified Pseudomonas]|uniref:hypothetical protein n=1 Tax=unclassified Pseudomonas TaxID=196821 RepID=UPI00131CEFCF|nr:MULTISPECIES: hypothetical protein [unclassified Pseudomonas]